MTSYLMTQEQGEWLRAAGVLLILLAGALVLGWFLIDKAMSFKVDWRMKCDARSEEVESLNGRSLFCCKSLGHPIRMANSVFLPWHFDSDVMLFWRLDRSGRTEKISSDLSEGIRRRM